MTRSDHWIGFDRRIELSWLDVAAIKVVEGASEQDVRQDLLSFLQSLSLDPEESGSARPKTIRVILRIWGAPDTHLKRFNDSCARLFISATPSDRLALHWAMTLAAYPYFFSHATVIGRMLGLQDTVSAQQIRRRIQDVWGERSTVHRTSRYVVRTMVAWGVLDERGKGVYSRSSASYVVTASAGVKLVRAVLYNTFGSAVALSQLVSHPSLFPFEFRLGLSDLTRGEGFEVTQEAGTVMVGLRSSLNGEKPRLLDQECLDCQG